MWLDYMLFLKKLSVKARNKAIEAKDSRLLKEHFIAVKDVSVLIYRIIIHYCHYHHLSSYYSRSVSQKVYL